MTAKSIEHADAGLPGDSEALKLLTEIQMIAHLASNEFEHLLPDGLTEAQYGVLNRLMRIGTDETIGELAAAFQVAHPTMSSTVKRLEGKGLVALVPSETDRRVKHVRITPSGKRMRRKVVRSLEPELNRFLAQAPDVSWARALSDLTVLRRYLDERRNAGFTS